MTETMYKLGKTTWRIDLDASGDHCWVSDQVFDSFVTEEELLEMGASPLDKPTEAVGTMRTVRGYLSGDKVREIVEKYKDGGTIGLVDLAVEVEVPESWDKPQPIQSDEAECEHEWVHYVAGHVPWCKKCLMDQPHPPEPECTCIEFDDLVFRHKSGCPQHQPHPQERGKNDLFDWKDSSPTKLLFSVSEDGNTITLGNIEIKVTNTLNSLTGKEEGI